MLIEFTSLLVISLLAGISIHYLSHRMAWALEREWLDESLDFLDLDDQRTEFRSNLAYPDQLPALWHIWPFISQEKTLDGPYTPWWLSGLFFILFCAFNYQFGFGFGLACAVLFSVICILASRIDYCHQVLPDKLTILLIWAGLAVNSFGVFTSLSDAVWASLLGYTIIGGMTSILSKLFKRTMLGGGDVKFIAGIGAWVGLKGLLPVILIGSIVFVLVMVLGGWLNDQWHRMSAFGPYLTLGGLVTLWMGPANLFSQLQSWLSF